MARAKKNKLKRKRVYSAKNWSVYIVRCADLTLYTGISNNVKERLKKHNGGRGARYVTAGRRPVSLVYEERGFAYGKALKREREIKRAGKKGKEGLLVSQESGKVRRSIAKAEVRSPESKGL